MKYEDYELLLERLLKQHKTNRPDIPKRILNESTELVIKAYQKEYNRLYRELLDMLVDDFSIGESPTTSEVASVIAQIERRLNELHEQVTIDVSNELTKNYITAHAQHSIISEQIKEIAVLQTYAPYSLINHPRAEQLIEDTMGDLLFATQHTSKELKKVVRDIFNKHLTLAGLTNENYRDLANTIRKELTRKGFSEKLIKEGFIGIIDASGRRWNLRTYVEMVVNTKMSQAYHEGLKDVSMSTGKDLAKVSENNSPTPCKYFEGMIISMTGQTEGYMTYDQLQATGMIFHPNCQHTCFPIGRIELLHPTDLQHHTKKMEEVGAGLKKYNTKK